MRKGIGEHFLAGHFLVEDDTCVWRRIQQCSSQQVRQFRKCMQFTSNYHSTNCFVNVVKHKCKSSLHQLSEKSIRCGLLRITPPEIGSCRGLCVVFQAEAPSHSILLSPEPKLHSFGKKSHFSQQ